MGSLAEKYAAIAAGQSLADKYAAIAANAPAGPPAQPSAPAPKTEPFQLASAPQEPEGFADTAAPSRNLEPAIRNAGQVFQSPNDPEGANNLGFGAWLYSQTHKGEDAIPRNYPNGNPGSREWSFNTPGAGSEAGAISRTVADENAQIRAGSPTTAIANDTGSALVPAAAMAMAPELAPELAPYLAPAKLGEQIGSAVGQGTVYGGVERGLNSKADTVGGRALDAAKGAVQGGAAAGLTAGVIGGAAKVPGALASTARGGADTLAEVATEQRLAGAGVERAGMKKLRAKAGGLERYAEGADRLGIGKQGILPSTVRTHAEDARAAAEAAGATKDAIVSQLEQAGATVHGADVGAAIRKLKAGHGKSVGNEIESIAREFDDMGEVPWSEMNLERKDIGAGTAWDATSVRAKLSKKVYGRINDAMADAAEKIDPGAGAAWRQANEDEHIALKLAEMGENKLNTAGNRGISPTDYAAGITGTVLGGPGGGAAGVVANKVVRAVEHPIASAAAKAGASGLNSLANGLESFAAPAGSAVPTRAGSMAAAAEAAPQRANSSVDRAVSDPTYGTMLAAHPPGEQRDIVYSTLLIQDPKFRERERARAQNQQQEEQD